MAVTLGSLITDLQTYTNRPATILTTAIGTTLVNSAMERVQHAHQWRGQEHQTDITYQPSDDGVPLPSDFISDFALWDKDASQTDPARALTPIDKVTRREWIERLVIRRGTDNDQVFPTGSGTIQDPDGTFYYLWNDRLFVVSQPSSATLFQLDYYRMLPDLIDTTDQNFFTRHYSHLMRWGALAEAWAFLFEDERAAVADARFERLLQAGIKNDVTLSSSGGPISRGV